MRIPPALAAEWRREPEWLDDLPRLAAECAAAWDLELEEPYDTPRSLVVPAGAAVLKLNAPSHFEADHEADALACWDGKGAVRLLARDDERRALLLERCVPGGLLAEEDTDEVSIMAELLERLPGAAPSRSSLPAGRATRPSAGWRRCRGGGSTAADRSSARSSMPRSRCSAASTAVRPGLVNQDLHAWNVLRSEREPWLVIDPKPLVGEREVDGVGPLRNAGFSGDTAVVGRWLDALADLGMDRDRLRGWGTRPRPRVGLRPRPVVDPVDRGRADDQPRLTACSV